eukprot:6382106-Pyramimonas_sp.AAC.1
MLLLLSSFPLHHPTLPAPSPPPPPVPPPPPPPPRETLMTSGRGEMDGRRDWKRRRHRSGNRGGYLDM